jgi:hypothetical protein
MVGEAAGRILAEHIVSVEQLEILLLLREHRDRSWTAERVNNQIKSSVASVGGRLVDLAERGLLHRSGEAYQYRPAPELERAMTEVAKAYSESRFAVIDLIFAKPSEKLRVFADAFKMKKGGKDHG